MIEREKFYLSTVDANAHAVAVKYGLGIEIAEYCTAWNMDDKYQETDPQVWAALEGIENRVLHAPFNELFPCAIDPKARELAKYRYKQAISLAQRYGAEKVVIHGGYNPWIYFPVWYTGESVPFWKEFLCEIPDGMTVCLENVLEEQPHMLRDIVKAVDDPKIRICLDIGHANSYSKVTVMQWLEECAPYISHFHLHNNDGSWDTHSALDQGTIPVRELLARSEELCSGATYTLELTESEPSVHWLLEV